MYILLVPVISRTSYGAIAFGKIRLGNNSLIEVDHFLLPVLMWTYGIMYISDISVKQCFIILIQFLPLNDFLVTEKWD